MGYEWFKYILIKNFDVTMLCVYIYTKRISSQGSRYHITYQRNKTRWQNKRICGDESCYSTDHVAQVKYV